MKILQQYSDIKSGEDICISTFLDGEVKNLKGNKSGEYIDLPIHRKKDLYIFNIIENPNLLIVINKCPTLKSYLLHILTQNDKDPGLYHGVFTNIGSIDEEINNIKFETNRLTELRNFNLGKDINGNSFMRFSL